MLALVLVALPSTVIISTVAGKEVKKLPIYAVKTDEKKVAISFDCAWGVDYTDKLLSIMQEENVKTGKSMLEGETKRRGYNLNDILTEESFLVLSSKMSFNSQEEMFASIGCGAVTVNQVLVKLIDYYRKNQPQQEIAKFYTSSKHQSSGVTVKGMQGILVRFAGCCNPVPGDDIVGFISRGHGVTVHRKDCPNLKNAEDGRLIEVNWANKDSSIYNAGIKVIGTSQIDILTSVASCVAQLKLEIVSTNGRVDNHTKQVVVDFNIRLNGKHELESLITKIKQDSKIIDVYRTANK